MSTVQHSGLFNLLDSILTCLVPVDSCDPSTQQYQTQVPVCSILQYQESMTSLQSPPSQKLCTYLIALYRGELCFYLHFLQNECFYQCLVVMSWSKISDLNISLDVLYFKIYFSCTLHSNIHTQFSLEECFVMASYLNGSGEYLYLFGISEQKKIIAIHWYQTSISLSFALLCAREQNLRKFEKKKPSEAIRLLQGKRQHLLSSNTMWCGMWVNIVSTIFFFGKTQYTLRQ